MKRNSQSPKSPRRQAFLLWLLLAVALAIVLVISFVDDVSIGGLSLRKATFPEVIMAQQEAEDDWEDYTADMAEEGEEVTAEKDTTVKNVLVFGDSMTILVANRLAAYGEKNGYTVTSVTWDGSSTIAWSSCDTIDNYIERYHPDFLFVTLGSNELFLKNFDSRKPYVQKLVKKFGGIPFVWIGPPNWKKDAGFHKMMKSALPRGTYFDSDGLDLPRGKDNVHPTVRGGIIWTDSIMNWIATSAHPILAEKPDPGVGTRMHRTHYFKVGQQGGKASAPTEAKEDEAKPSPSSEESPASHSPSQPSDSEPSATATP